jgi:hypothetical protein
MAQHHPLFDTFRAAEDLVNKVDQRLIILEKDGTRVESGYIRQETALLMLYLVESFPRVSVQNPSQSLAKARESLLHVRSSIQALPPTSGNDQDGHDSLVRSCERVVTKLSFTMSWMADDKPTTATRRHEPIPSGLKSAMG